MPTIDNINAAELKQKLDAGEVECLLDVREEWEHSLVSLPGSIHIPVNELVDRMMELAFEEEIVVYCHTGHRSRQAADILVESGVKTVHNLLGGIDAYSQVADASVPRYRPAM